MSQEPKTLRILRLLISFATLSILGMLYWSSTIVEERLQLVQAELALLKVNVNSLSQKAFLKQEASAKANSTNEETGKATSNLLSPDPFYTTTLPKLLGDNFTPNGILKNATIVKPDNLHPFSEYKDVIDWVGFCNVSAAKSKIGRYETYAPDMAESIEEKINPATSAKEFWIKLRDDVFWEPLNPSFFPSGTTLAEHFLKRHQVTAEDFILWFDAIKNPYVDVGGAIALRNYYDDVEEMKMVDKLTLVMTWKTHDVKEDEVNAPTAKGSAPSTKKIKYTAKQWTGGLRPLASFVYKYFANGKKIVEEDQDLNTYRTSSLWAQNFGNHFAKNIIVSCGAWIFDGMTDRQIKFIRNPNFYNPLAVLVEKLEISFKATPDNIWQAFKSLELTQCALQPEQLLSYHDYLKSPAYLKQKAMGQSIQQISYTNRTYAYVGWNQANPLFSNKRIRQALTMGIDRKRIIEKNLQGMGVETNGTIYRYSPSYNNAIEPWPYHPSKASKILEEEGWTDMDGDGIIDKVIDGKITPFRFTLTYFVKNQTFKSICEYIATSLKAIGIDCRLKGVDIADLSATFEEKSFDALAMMWVFGTPPENLRQLWSSAGALEKGSSNMVGFANSEADSIIEKLDFEYDPSKRLNLYHRFSEILHDEQPYTFLYTPKILLLYREELQNVFLPVERKDLIPNADVASPMENLFWIKSKN